MLLVLPFEEFPEETGQQGALLKSVLFTKLVEAVEFLAAHEYRDLPLRS